MQESVVIKNLDHLGLVAAMVDDLEIEKSVDNELPVTTNKKKLSYGTLVKAMILNGLGYLKKQLYLTPQFFMDRPLETLFSQTIDAQQINDDALGRTLDAIYNYGVSELYEKIAYKAITCLYIGGCCAFCTRLISPAKSDSLVLVKFFPNDCLSLPIRLDLLCRL